VRDSVEAVPPNPKAELEALGIKSLVAMLMTYDAGNEARDIRISQRDSEAQEAQAELEARTNRSGRPSDVDEYGVDIVPKRYREIYIHSKLMFVDDVYTTLGSANLNSRSMVSDSEFNICTADYEFTQEARRRVWGNLAGWDLDGGDGGLEAVADTHDKWVKRMDSNNVNRRSSKPKAPVEGSFLHPFEDPRGVPFLRFI
jgi:phosphatidylserine/phosphatidylglycerophosphate/cardiolipin synthase-like enzyme